MTTTTDRTGRNAQRARFRLLHKLLAAVAALCALLALALLFVVEPRTNAAFRDRSAVLVEHELRRIDLLEFGGDRGAGKNLGVAG